MSLRLKQLNEPETGFLAFIDIFGQITLITWMCLFSPGLNQNRHLMSSEPVTLV